MNDIGKYCIEVGDPWDFINSDGNATIKGEILNIVNSHCLIFKSNNTVHITGKKGNIFILSPRYESDDLNDLYYVGSFPVNGELLTCSYSKDISMEKIRNNSVFVLVGSIKNMSLSNDELHNRNEIYQLKKIEERIFKDRINKK